MSNETFMLIGAVLLIASVAVVDLLLVAATYNSRKSQWVKFAWSALVVLLPGIGWAIWGRLGPRGVARAPSSPEHSK